MTPVQPERSGQPGQSTLRAIDRELVDLQRAIGGACRCVRCCCEPGQGHNNPKWERYLELQDVAEQMRRA